MTSRVNPGRPVRIGFSEGYRNLTVASPGLVAAFVCVLALAGLAGAIEAAQATDAEARYRRFGEDGGNIVVVTAADALLDTRACLALRSTTGVVRTAGVGDAKTVHLGAVRSVPARQVPAVGDLLRILDPVASTGGPGVAVGFELASELRVAPRATTTIDGHPVQIAAVFDPDQRDPSWSGRILNADPTLSRLRQCYIEFQPDARTAVVDVARSTFSWTGAEVRFLRFNGREGSDAAGLLNSRRTRSIGLFAGAASATVIAGVWILRRSTWAAYRVSGFRWPSAVLLSWAEAVIAATVASLLAAESVIAAVLVFDPSGSKGAALLGLRSVAGAAAVVFAAAPPIAAAAVPRSIGTTLKETG